MDEEAIGLVLARATELRLSITNCIHKATPAQNGPNSPEQGDAAEELNETEEDAEESGRLWNIRDALESLESQLSSLQAMQQNQKYEKEVALADIEESRRVLLEKLKEYKGNDLQVIQEATVFASETVEQSSDLLLPPYPTRPPLSIRIGYKSAGSFSSDLTNGIKKNNPNEETHRNPSRGGGLARLIGTVAKTAVTLVGVVSILRLAANNQKGVKFGAPLRVLNMFLPSVVSGEEGGLSVDCPPGKVLVVEGGKPRCLVKERVEVPFGIGSSVSNTADVNFGCG